MNTDMTVVYNADLDRRVQVPTRTVDHWRGKGWVPVSELPEEAAEEPTKPKRGAAAASTEDATTDTE